MALTANILIGKVAAMWISTDAGTTWKQIVCSTGDIVVRGTQTTGAETATRCGTHKAPGTSGWEMSGAGAGNSSISAGTEVSINELATLFQNNTSFKVRVRNETDPTDYYRSGDAYFSAYEETSAIDGFTGFTFTAPINGNLVLVAP